MLGAVLLIAISGLIYLYVTANKRETARHELHRQDMRDMATANRTERERWQTVDDKRFADSQGMVDRQIDVQAKNTDALAQLSTIIRERIKA